MKPGKIYGMLYKASISAGFSFFATNGTSGRQDMGDLLSTISASDKRRNLLVFLNSGPREWDDIKKTLAVTSTGMLPQIKILEDEYLIERDGRRYSLTPMGKVLSDRLVPLVQTIGIFDRHKKFWQDHNLDVLPHEVLLNIGWLGDYGILAVPDEDLFNVNPFLANLASAKTLRGIAHTVHPKFPEFFTALAKKNVRTSLIFTPKVYLIVSENYADLLEQFLKCKSSELYVSRENLKFSFAVSDSYFSISLFYNSGVFDSKHDVISRDPSALRWGDQIFTYFRERSEKIGTPG